MAEAFRVQGFLASRSRGSKNRSSKHLACQERLASSDSFGWKMAAARLSVNIYLRQYV